MNHAKYNIKESLDNSVLTFILENESIITPVYETVDASGMDIRSKEDTIVPAHGRVLVHTGVKAIIPPDFEIQVRPRSGLALKKGITVLNTPGTIDNDYQGELGVILFNTTDVDFIVNKNDRIAQLVLAPVCRMQIKPVISSKTNIVLPKSSRGEKGFGSTGQK